jgi:hypothetical protein
MVELTGGRVPSPTAARNGAYRGPLQSVEYTIFARFDFWLPTGDDPWIVFEPGFCIPSDLNRISCIFEHPVVPF